MRHYAMRWLVAAAVVWAAIGFAIYGLLPALERAFPN